MYEEATQETLNRIEKLTHVYPELRTVKGKQFCIRQMQALVGMLLEDAQ